MLSSEAYRLLDVGGTFIKRADGRAFPSASGSSREDIVAALRAAVGRTEGLQGIGVAIPGPFDFTNGIFQMQHKFAAVYGASFRELAGLPEDLPLRFDHDVATALRGAVTLLQLKRPAALITLGTGLGFAHALDGKVQYGPNGSPARALWNLPWKGGILEDVASARGIRAAYARLGGDGGASVLDIARKAYSGSDTAYEAFHETGLALGQALAPIVEELGIETLLFAGQIARSLLLLEDGLRAGLGSGICLTQAPQDAVFEGLANLFKT